VRNRTVVSVTKCIFLFFFFKNDRSAVQKQFPGVKRVSEYSQNRPHDAKEDNGVDSDEDA
jgi:hypothetical protein